MYVYICHVYLCAFRRRGEGRLRQRIMVPVRRGASLQNVVSILAEAVQKHGTCGAGVEFEYTAYSFDDVSAWFRWLPAWSQGP